MRFCWLCMLLLSWGSLHAREAFDLAGKQIASGTVSSWMMAVSSTAIPVTVIHGQTSGPVLTLTAGIHGDEFPSILALQQLRKQIQPEHLKGTLILIHLANLEGFHARRIALSPVDEKNLNRVFPGSAQGTLTEQIADFLTAQVISKTDYLIDIHSGSANQHLWPHVYSPVLHVPALDARTQHFADLLGLPDIVLYDGRPNDPDHSISYPNTAQTRGKPALTLEVGQFAQRDAAFVAMITQACAQAMSGLGMIDAPETIDVSTQHTTKVASPIHYYSKMVEVRSQQTGLFTAKSSIGDWVTAGQVVGEVTDYFGEKIETLRAPVSGRILIQNATPPIRAGEVTLSIGVVKAP
ncbi:M14 family metallopeptidase [Methylophilus sp. 13]|uniref:M14 family metallopeptidase n=1 Tax=Methylophilus sp. 13 TaxID=2781018 RepID=UPI001E311A32|nr:M14 family metallopeptidase [Methylophilus sp. 13]